MVLYLFLNTVVLFVDLRVGNAIRIALISLKL